MNRLKVIQMDTGDLFQVCLIDSHLIGRASGVLRNSGLIHLLQRVASHYSMEPVNGHLFTGLRSLNPRRLTPPSTPKMATAPISVWT